MSVTIYFICIGFHNNHKYLCGLLILSGVKIIVKEVVEVIVKGVVEVIVKIVKH